MIIIGFSGTRQGMSGSQRETIAKMLISLNPYGASTPRGKCRHGDCVGADTEFHVLAKSLGYEIEIHPPVETANRAFCKGGKIHPVKRYHDRNKDIVDLSDRLLATPGILSRGTWNAIEYAKRQGKPVMIIYPDSRYEYFNWPL
jgi:hypothetical protein